MAVINRTEFTKCIRLIQGIVFLVVLCGVGYVQTNPRGCEYVRAEFQAKDFPTSIFLDRPGDGPICGVDSCCGSEMELIVHNRYYLDKFLKNSLSSLSSLLDTRAKRFDNFFRDMMAKSKKEFHEMFEKTYGILYIQNSFVFTDFFDELERYYNKGQVRLAETMDNFFGILYQRMFTVINSQYHFDEKYLGCVAEHMTALKPFGDVPHKLSVQLRRSFVATRTFYKAIAMGADVVQNMMSLKADEECGKELVRLRQCGICKGLQGPGACSAYCIDTLQSCLYHHTILNNHWDNYIEALDKVGERLSGPFNIEMVVEPINIKISEAIMNFQESGSEVSQRIFTVCGSPTLGRERRNASQDTKTSREHKSNDEIPLESLNFHGKKKHKKTETALPTLEKLIKEIRLKVKDSRQFWLHLPYQFCNNEASAARPSDDDKCWNGTALDRYETINTSSTKKPPISVQGQMYTLQVLSERLHNAYQGQDVDFADDTEEPLYGSGSGSGDGDYEESGSAVDNYDNEVETPAATQPPSSTTSTQPPVVRKGPTSSANTISLTRALAYYILPIVLVWFEGAISDLL